MHVVTLLVAVDVLMQFAQITLVFSVLQLTLLSVLLVKSVTITPVPVPPRLPAELRSADSLQMPAEIPETAV